MQYLQNLPGHLETTWQGVARSPGGSSRGARWATPPGTFGFLSTWHVPPGTSTWHRSRVTKMLRDTGDAWLANQSLIAFVCFRQVDSTPGGPGRFRARWAPGGHRARWAPGGPCARWACEARQVGFSPGGPGGLCARLRQVGLAPGGKVGAQELTVPKLKDPRGRKIDTFKAAVFHHFSQLHCNGDAPHF